MLPLYFRSVTHPRKRQNWFYHHPDDGAVHNRDARWLADQCSSVLEHEQFAHGQFDPPLCRAHDFDDNLHAVYGVGRTVLRTAYDGRQRLQRSWDASDSGPGQGLGPFFEAARVRLRSALRGRGGGAEGVAGGSGGEVGDGVRRWVRDMRDTAAQPSFWRKLGWMRGGGSSGGVRSPPVVPTIGGVAPAIHGLR